MYRQNNNPYYIYTSNYTPSWKGRVSTAGV